MTWRDAIMHYRKRHQVKQWELAEQLKVSISTVSKWEQGRTVPHRQVVDRLYALGIKGEYPQTQGA